MLVYVLLCHNLLIKSHKSHILLYMMRCKEDLQEGCDEFLMNLIICLCLISDNLSLKDFKDF